MPIDYDDDDALLNSLSVLQYKLMVQPTELKEFSGPAMITQDSTDLSTSFEWGILETAQKTTLCELAS